MHLLCTYLDSHMPLNPWFPDGRLEGDGALPSFHLHSSCHFLSTWGAVSLKKKKKIRAIVTTHTECLLWTTSLVPRPLPDFIPQLWRKLEWPGNEARSSAQCEKIYLKAKMSFLHHRQINLELSGINFLWIIQN